MTKVLHDKIEIHPSDSAHTALLKATANATLEEAAELDGGKTYSPEFHADGWKIAIETRGDRLWASYCGPRAPSDMQEPGRVWIEHAAFSPGATEFRFISPCTLEALSTIWHGHDSGWTIHTYPYTFANHYAPEGPTSKPDHYPSTP